MSQVTLQILGRPYTVACAEGQEAHIEKLGGMIAAKLDGMDQTAPQPDQNLLFAALFLADELEETRKAGKSSIELESQLASMKNAQATSSGDMQELQLERDALLSERDTMRVDHENAKTQLAEAKAELEQANAQLTQANDRVAHANVQIAQLETQKAAVSKGPNLAPQLEEMANALEKCASKLEAQA
ncbi:MAG: cell division protein ZapA [Marinomonas sp.]